MSVKTSLFPQVILVIDSILALISRHVKGSLMDQQTGIEFKELLVDILQVHNYLGKDLSRIPSVD